MFKKKVEVAELKGSNAYFRSVQEVITHYRIIIILKGIKRQNRLMPFFFHKRSCYSMRNSTRLIVRFMLGANMVIVVAISPQKNKRDLLQYSDHFQIF